MAFRQAAASACPKGMPKCSPVLLEPIMEVEIADSQRSHRPASTA
jgi:elongation factor G